MPATQKSVLYRLTGARRGHSGKFFGFAFKDGDCLISGEAHDNCGHVLRDHYVAYPADEADKMNAAAEAAGIKPAAERRGPEMVGGVMELGDDGSVKAEAGVGNVAPVLPPRASKKR